MSLFQSPSSECMVFRNFYKRRFEVELIRAICTFTGSVLDTIYYCPVGFRLLFTYNHGFDFGLGFCVGPYGGIFP